MKRRTRQWGRILFNTLTAISLLLAIATAGLWVRSGFCKDVITSHAYIRTDLFTEHLRTHDFVCGVGVVNYQLRDVEIIPPSIVDFGNLPKTGWQHQIYDETILRTGIYRFLPVSLLPTASGPTPPFGVRFSLGVPLWLPLLLFLALPLYAAVRTRSIINEGRYCPTCGYDTRANPAKCSECGHEMPDTTEVESA